MPANTTNILQGTEYVTNLQAGGGTYMADAVKAALKDKVEDGRSRYVFFMTDGYVGNEAQIIADAGAYVKAHKKNGQRAKVFGFGVGSSVNRYLLDGLGKEGEGLTVYSTTREDPVTSVNKFYRYIDSPVIEDIKIDWNGLQVSDVYPSQTPDLFASHPMTLHAKIAEQAGEHTIFVRGKYNGKTIELPVQVTTTAQNLERAPLATLWARSKVNDLERDLWNGNQASTIDAITALGLSYRMVTKYTSFVAVDKSSKVDGKSQTIVQPVETPEGVDASMAGPGQVQYLQAAPPAKKAMAYENYGSVGLGLSGTGSGGGGYGAIKGTAVGDSAGLGGLARRKEEARPAATVAPKDDAPKAEAERDEKRADKATKSVAPALILAGNLDRNALLGLLASHKAEVKACFESAKQTGSITLHWFVTSAGVALQVKMLSSSDKSLEQCLAAKLKTWSFPKASGNNAEITFTFSYAN
jgi:Ca-activated chloride channel family protein